MANKGNGLRAVDYTRVSTKEQALEGYSLANQLTDIKKYADFKDIELVGKDFTDEGISGSTITERKGVQEAIKYAIREKVDYIIVWKLSRLSRRLSDLIEISELLEENGIGIIAIKDNIDTKDPMGKFFLHLMGIIAELERDTMITQVTGGMTGKARKGEFQGGIAPLGYDVLDKKLAINEEEAQIVRLIFNLYNEDKGYTAIRDVLKQEKHKTKKGNDFSPNTVKGILTNSVYKGEMVWGRLKGWGKKDKEGKRKRNYNEKPITVKNAHPAIIPEEEFDKVQEKIEGNPRRHVKRFQGHHLLTGLLRCPRCGAKMSYHFTTKEGSKYEYYICNEYSGKRNCDYSTLPKMEIEAEFYSIFSRAVEEKEFREAIITASQENGWQITEVENQITDRKNAIDEIETKIESAIDKMVDEDSKSITKRLKQRIDDYETEVKNINEDIKRDKERLEELRSRMLDGNEILEVLLDVGKVIKLLDKEAQQRLVRSIVQKVEVENKHVKAVHFCFDRVLGKEEVSRTLP